MYDDVYEEQQNTSIDIAQICLNGHVINAAFLKYPIHNKKFCPDCGETTITACSHCNKNIPGEIHYTNVVGFSDFKVPLFCAECGKSYLWTEKKLSAAKELASELDGLTPDEKKILEKSIDEISKNNPQASVGATRFKKLMLKAGSATGEILKDVITDIASETAKKILLGK